MQASLEKLSTTKCRLKVVLQADQIETNQKKELQKYMRELEIPGFQKGKVPASYIERRFGKSLEQDVLRDMVQSSFENAVKENNIHYLGYPQFDVDFKQYQKGQDFSYQVEMDTESSYELIDLTGQNLTKVVAKITPEDVEKVLNDLPKTAPNWVDVTRESKEGDRITLDYKGLCQGKGYPHNVAKNVKVILDGSGRFMPEFEKQLYGLKVNETKTIQLTYPKTYRLKQVAGKTVDLTITITKVEEKTYPELNEDFAKLYGIEEGGIDKLREELRQNMENETQKLSERLLRDAAFKCLRDINTFDIPETLINSMKREYLFHFDPTLRNKKAEELKSVIEDSSHQVHQKAAQYAKDMLLREKFTEKFNIKLSNDDFNKMVSEFIQGLDPMEAYQYMTGHRKIDPEYVQGLAIVKQLTAKLLEGAIIVETSMPYFEFIKNHKYTEDLLDHDHDHDDCDHDHDHDHSSCGHDH